jgi:hypothetical protein
MTKFHAVMLDETGQEFGVDLEAEDRDDAYDQLDEDYPESRCVQLESRADTAKREQAMHNHIAEGGDWDDDGRPIFHY